MKRCRRETAVASLQPTRVQSCHSIEDCCPNSSVGRLHDTLSWPSAERINEGVCAHLGASASTTAQLVDPCETRPTAERAYAVKHTSAKAVMLQ